MRQQTPASAFAAASELGREMIRYCDSSADLVTPEPEELIRDTSNPAARWFHQNCGPIVPWSEKRGVDVRIDADATDIDAPSLWRATSYCPTIEQREELLGVSTEFASALWHKCQSRVADANQR